MSETTFNITTIIAIAGFILGVVSTTLSLVNFFINLRDRKISLRVTPKVSFSMGSAFISNSIYRKDFDEIAQNNIAISGKLPIPTIEVANLSRFTIEIEEVGFCQKTPRRNRRAIFLQPTTLPDGKPPYRLEPRSSRVFYATRAESVFWSDDEIVRYAYAITGCGHIETKWSRDFIRMKEDIKTTVNKIAANNS